MMVFYTKYGTDCLLLSKIVAKIIKSVRESLSIILFIAYIRKDL